MSLIPFGFWAASGAGGGAGAFDLLETTTLTSSASSVTFSGLDTLAAGYQHLQIRAVVKASESSTNRNFNIRFNSDNGNNYAVHRLAGTGSAVESEGYGSLSSTFGAQIPGASITDAWGAVVTSILDFSSSSKNTTLRQLYGWAAGSGQTTRVGLGSGLWNSTSAVTAIELYGSTFITGSRFSLIGVK